MSPLDWAVRDEVPLHRFIYTQLFKTLYIKGERIMRLEISVPEAVEIFKEIRAANTKS